MHGLTALFFLACGGSTPAPEAAAQRPAPVAVSAPVAPPMKPVGGDGSPTAEPTVGQPFVLQLDPELLSYGDDGTAIFAPDSRRQAAHYTKYRLDTAGLEAALGGRPEQPAAVLIQVTGMEERTSVPEDPNMPQPDGGFHYTTWVGEVVGKAPGE